MTSNALSKYCEVVRGGVGGGRNGAMADDDSHSRGTEFSGDNLGLGSRDQ
jgi:hypothetical protein